MNCRRSPSKFGLCFALATLLLLFDPKHSAAAGLPKELFDAAASHLASDLNEAWKYGSCRADPIWCVRDAALRDELLQASSQQGALAQWRKFPHAVTENRPGMLLGGLETVLLTPDGSSARAALNDEKFAFGEALVGATPNGGHKFTADSILRSYLILTMEESLGVAVQEAALVVEHGGGSALGAQAIC